MLERRLERNCVELILGAEQRDLELSAGALERRRGRRNVVGQLAPLPVPVGQPELLQLARPSGGDGVDEQLDVEARGGQLVSVGLAPCGHLGPTREIVVPPGRPAAADRLDRCRKVGQLLVAVAILHREARQRSFGVGTTSAGRRKVQQQVVRLVDEQGVPAAQRDKAVAVGQRLGRGGAPPDVPRHHSHAARDGRRHPGRRCECVL
eukprot:scaffold8023_cov103-Isochrysis_galbana.AAC.17